MFERYTKGAKNTLVSARREAQEFGCPEIKPEHILLALLKDDGTTREILKNLSREDIRNQLSMGQRGVAREAPVGTLSLNSDALRALYYAAEEADLLKEEHIGNEHLLMGLLRVESCYPSLLLKEKGITAHNVRSQIVTLGTRTPAPEKAKKTWRSLFRGAGSRRDEEVILLRRISKLVGQGKSRKALKVIDEFLAQPSEDKIKRITKFAPHAAAIARAIGDVSMARRYYEQAIEYSRDSPGSLYGMADVLDLQGEHARARECAIRCYQLAVAGKDQLSKGFVELVEKRFPDLGTIPPIPDH
jgi:tetratricopeptide (TPR) repeat protein